MGECVKHNGEITKIGTCESLYYTTYAQYLEALKAGELKKAEGNDTPLDYINPEHNYRFRFPFPDEKKIEMGTHDDFDRGVLIFLPSDLFPEVDDLTGTHSPVNFKVNVKAEDDNTKNRLLRDIPIFNTPCPISREFRNLPEMPEGWKVSNKDKLTFIPISIIQQRAINNQLWVIARCPYCNAAWRYPESDWQIITDYILDPAHPYSSDVEEIAKIGLSGYEIKTDEIYNQLKGKVTSPVI